MDMIREGHTGLTLTVVFSTYILLNLRGIIFMLDAILITMLSTLPDIDIRLEISHRKYTHNILFAVIIGIIISTLYYYLNLPLFHGFIVGFSSVILHILGDVMTYMKFNPLYPFLNCEIGLGLFKSDNKVVNFASLFTGIVVLLAYLARI